VDGTPFGRYLLIALLGRGGMGEVWRAFDTVTERVVALKVLPERFADDQVFQQRFRREARTAAGLNEPHVVPIHDFGEIDGRLYVTMRLIEGRDLQTILADGPIEPARAVHIIEQVASALNAAHRIALIHRDVKPSNILVADEDFTYLIDFGIARATGETSLTNTGNVLGTFAYLAPERVTTGDTDHRVDIYALTCVMHECLTGSRPFPGDSLEQQLGGHLTMPPPRPSTIRGNIPAQLDAVIAKGMAKNPDERYASTKELASAARAALNSPTSGPQPVWPTRPPPHFPPHPPPDHRPPMAPGVSPSAPTQFGPAPGPTQFAAAPGPAQFGPPPGPAWPPPPGPAWPPPPQGPPSNDQTRRSRRRIAWAGGAAAVIALIGTVVLVMVFTNKGDQVNNANTGPFTGEYRADFGPSTTHGKPDQGATPSTGQWAIRSSCSSTGCVATATATDGPTLQSSFVFDDIGGQWHTVAVTTAKSPPAGVTGFSDCKFPSEYWTDITLQRRPDGTLAGQYRAAGVADRCETERTVTFTRIGDVDPRTVSDPTGHPARVKSPAEAWRGRYQGTETPEDGRKPNTWNSVFETDCLRTGKRCITYTHNDNGWDFYVFGDGKWVYNWDGKRTCTDGGTDHVKYHWEFPLPQPSQDPIPLITGSGRVEVTDTVCAGSFNEDVKYERTGD
jgi:serine/threonine protein kinase